jgi:recA bacterial DNA recombination protein
MSVALSLFPEPEFVGSSEFLGVPRSSPALSSEELQGTAVAQLRASLAGTAAANITNGAELIRALARTRREELIPTTLAPFDELLGGGLPRGKMVELTGRRTTGRFSIVLSALAAATSMGEAAVLVDLGNHLDPQLAEANGADLQRLLWIRPKTLKQAVMATEMIAATGFQLVALDLGLHPLRGRRVPDAAWVRLGRTAEAHGAAMLISSPYPLTGTASEAVVVAGRARMKWLGRGKSPRVLAGVTVDLRLEKHRHRKPGARAALSLTVMP